MQLRRTGRLPGTSIYSLIHSFIPRYSLSAYCEMNSVPERAKGRSIRFPYTLQRSKFQLALQHTPFGFSHRNAETYTANLRMKRPWGGRGNLKSAPLEICLHTILNLGERVKPVWFWFVLNECGWGELNRFLYSGLFSRITCHSQLCGSPTISCELWLIWNQ